MKRVKYEIGYDLFSLIPASVTLLVFDGTTVILKTVFQSNHLPRCVDI